MHIALQQHMGVQGDIDLGQRGGDVLLGIKVDTAKRLLQPSGAGIGEVNVAVVIVGGEKGVGIFIGDELAHQSHDLQFGCLPMAGAGQHERHQCLVHQHRVGLVDDRDVGVGRHQIGDIDHQLIAQHIESDFIDRRVGDIALVGGAAFLAGRIGRDPPHGQTHGLDQRTHPLGVATGQVVVDGHHMDIAAGQRVTGGGDRPGECLTLAGTHLNDVAGHHAQRPEQLDVEGTQAGGALGGLASNGQELRGVGRLGEILKVQQPGRLGQLLGIEALCFLGELRGRRDLRHRMRFDLFIGRTEQSPESSAQTALA